MTDIPRPKYMPGEKIVYKSGEHRYGFITIKNIYFHDHWGDGSVKDWVYADESGFCREPEVLYSLSDTKSPSCACQCKKLNQST